MKTMASPNKKRLASQCSFDDDDFAITNSNIKQIDDAIQKYQSPNSKETHMASATPIPVTPNISTFTPNYTSINNLETVFPQEVSNKGNNLQAYH